MTETTNIFVGENKDIASSSGVTFFSTALEVAAYIAVLYRKKFSDKIDEMKLHKLLYFVQRETIASTGSAAFEEEFRAWKYGPVMLCVRDAYKNNTFPDIHSFETDDKLKKIINKVFDDYAERSSWSLSDVTHGELSWRNARKGIPDGENGSNPMKLSDIQKDAERLKYSRARAMLKGVIDGFK